MIKAVGWLAEFDTGFAAIAGRFGRVEPRQQAPAFLLAAGGAVPGGGGRAGWSD